MRIKKYTATSMKEALLRIKQDLGEDAMILKTRKLPRKLFAVGSQEEIEVTAAVDDGVAAAKQPPLKPLAVSDPGVYGRPRTSAGRVPPSEMPTPAAPVKAEPAAAAPPAGAQTSPMDRLRLLEIREDIREMKDLVKSILQTGETAAAGGFAGPWAVLNKRMVDADVQPAIVEELIRQLKGQKGVADAEIEQNFIKVVGDQFPVSGPLNLGQKKPLVVALVGPTGSGKTTTLAKLAAHYALDKKSSVSLVTADTYRIAAIEQIRTFADIVNIGLQVVFSAEEAADAMKACAQNDLVLIDTAGRSPRNREQLAEARELLTAFKPDEVHLVLSAATKESDLDHTIRQYRNFGVSRLIFTKLDETLRLGNVFNIVRGCGIPVSYFTTGQSVPDDIELAQPGRFIQRLWEGSSL
jgi:flagellar biosynthesis protein FlhF